ncbi:MAG: PorT family protein [Bacteroidales bacterium]|nr:PorT family protein [Bacteroidales bacterium]MBR6876409.1 PorT family protein [Bacteroidales bacterium]
MKKLIVIVASLLVAVSAHAQFGIVAGITSSKATIDAALSDVQNVTQYHVGLTYKIDLGIVAIQPALIYNVKGAKVSEFKELGDIASFDYKNGYLELPVQVQAGLNLGVARIYAIAEPFIGYAITNSTQSSNGNKIDVKWNEVKNKLEYGIGVGAGVELIKHVQISARYFWNLGNVEKVAIATVTDAVSNKAANGIVASVTLLF